MSKKVLSLLFRHQIINIFLHAAVSVVFLEEDGWKATNMTVKGMKIGESNER